MPQKLHQSLLKGLHFPRKYTEGTFGGFRVSGAGLLECFEQPEMFSFTIHFDSGGILTISCNPDAPYAELVARRCACALLRTCYLPQIAPSDVKSVAVNAVDFQFRPFVGHVEPSKAARLVELPIYANLIVPFVSTNAASNGASPDPTPAYSPPEYSGYWVVA